MIYTTNGLNHKADLKPFDIDSFDYLCQYVPDKIAITDYQERDIYKIQQAPYFISGVLSEPKRGSSYILARDLLVLDYDDANVDEKTFFKTLEEKLARIQWLIYPTIHCYNKGDNPGYRYRLVVVPDRVVTPDEYTKAIKALGYLIGLNYDPKSYNPSQMMGLPVLTPYTKQEQIQFFKGQSVPVTDLLLVYDKYCTPKAKQRNEVCARKRMKYTAQFMDDLLTGVSEGNRNNWLTSKIGTMLHQGMSARRAYEFAHFINNHCIQPSLSEQELDQTFESILERELQKGV